MEGLTIFTIASGWYRDYVDLFRWCAEKSYPKARVVVRELREPVVPYEAACRRLLEYPGGEYVYVTDVDMMLMPGLMGPHLRWMSDNDVCYSNTIRGLGEPFGCSRMTGLHFCRQEWYEKTKEWREFYVGEISRRKWGKSRFQDEFMLFDICRSSGLKVFSVRKPLVDWHFGIHMGTLRCHEKATRQGKNTQLDLRISPKTAQWWCDVSNDKDFQNVLKQVDEPRIQQQYDFLHSYARRRAKQ